MRKTFLFVLLALLALAPFARAQAQSGYYDQSGVYHPYDQNDGYYDRDGQWHSYDRSDRGDRNTNDGYYDRNGQWHPYDTQNPYDTQSGGYYDSSGRWHSYQNQNDGYYDQHGQWHSYQNDRYGRVTGPDRWSFRDRGRSETLQTAAGNLAYGTARIEREARRHSRYDDRAALVALGRLADQAQLLDRAVQQRNRNELIGSAYRNVIAAFFDVQRTWNALEPDAWLTTQLQVLFAQVGRLDHRYFGDRAFGGRSPMYGYDSSRDNDRYGVNPGRRY